MRMLACLACPLPNPASLQCYNISTTEPLTAAEAETLAWLLRETFEPELLTGATEFAAVGATDAVVEVRCRCWWWSWRCCSSCSCWQSCCCCLVDSSCCACCYGKQHSVCSNRAWAWR